MIGMVMHAKTPLDPCRDARTGPQGRGESGGLGPAQQGALKACSLSVAETGGASRNGLGAQRGLASSPRRRSPAPYTATIHAQASGHFNRSQSLLEQRQGAKPTPLQFLRATMRSHARSIGHYLCRSQ